MSEMTAPQKIAVHCDGCAKSFHVPTSAAGKKGKCPNCAQVIHVPQPVDHAFVAAVPSGDESSEPKKGLGRFMIGVIVASAFGLIGAVLWVVVMYFTGREFGLLAWGIGALVGVGMVMGYGQSSSTAGASAAGIALVSVLLPKLALIGLVILLSATSDELDVPYNAATARDELPQMMIDDMHAKAGRDFAFTSSVDDEFARRAAREHVSELPDEELELTWKRQRVAYLQADNFARTELNAGKAEADIVVPFNQIQSDANAMSLTQANAFLADWSPVGLSIGEASEGMFSVWDILFVALALLSAYKIASATS